MQPRLFGILKMFTQRFILQRSNAHIVTLNDHTTKHETKTSNGESFFIPLICGFSLFGQK
jgi:hypothetical protein